MPRPVALLSALLLLGPVVGCGDDEVGAAASSVLPAAESRYEDAALTWAWRDQVHYGDQVLTVPGDEWVDELQRTPYGFFLARCLRTRSRPPTHGPCSSTVRS